MSFPVGNIDYTIFTTILQVYEGLLKNPQSYIPYLSLYPTTIISPLITAILYCLIICYVCWFLSLVSRNYSWTDRFWSITPVFFAYIFTAKELYNAYQGVAFDPRAVGMFAVILTWGIRLTYNFYRKGGYNMKSQDYRWDVLMEKIPFVLFQVFNLLFIAVYQNILLLLIALPTYYISYEKRLTLTVVDAGLLALALSCVVFETISDQQQWNFQEDKYAKIAKKQKVTKNFITSGLWRYSRHPNFFCEQLLWVTIASLSYQTTLNGNYGNIIGAILLVLLFQGSTTFTEYITLGKYPEYKKYQLYTSRLIPLWSSSPSKSD